ncbi:hypothetical protein [Longitalea luteola]|uniref:hypothetical protein n=1 Tax=Longitalea luteola TaxID=2812563 RepID=UPI001A975BD5|nr:hypothetical protein [Longitalea luteola]
MARYLIITIMCAWILAGCNEIEEAVKDAKKDGSAPPKDNYIVLLDLSDRILHNNQQQVPKDIQVIQSIYAAFKSRLNAKDPTRLYFTVNDKLKLMVAPQRTTASEVYDMAGNLRLTLASAQPEEKAKLLEQTEKNFNTYLPQIYKKAVISNNSTAYAGADIWKYFNEDLQDDLEKDAQNTLFIITDGYMDFESLQGRTSRNNRYASCAQIINNLKKAPDWNSRFKEGDYGLLPVNKRFPNLKVVVLELNPKDDWTGEYNLLTTIWSKWFTEMGIKSYAFIKDDNINEINESIEKLLKVKLPSSANITSVSWTPVTDVDPEITKAARSKPKAEIQVSDPATVTEIAKETTQKKENSKSYTSYSSYAYSEPAATQKKKENVNKREYIRESAVRSQIDTSKSIQLRTNPKKPISKPKEQVTFGPAY